jgi:D-alanyl-lipoteichoic acid acyltransferase DltB (MBOAT superfamily)
MLFPTPEFAIFFFVVFIAAWLMRTRAEMRKAMLLAVSYFFYGYWDWHLLSLLAGSSTLNYTAGVALANTKDQKLRRRIVAIAVTLNLGVLGVFKYYNFFINSLTDLTLALGIHRDMPFLEIVLPIGISFFTFHGISYVVDIYRGHTQPVRSPLDLFLYISFFPQLVAGPIVRASHFLPQLKKTPVLNRSAIVFGFLLILNGMLKKVVLAHYIAVDLVDSVFADPSHASSLDLWAAQYAYAVQVYCDFSAYTDFAIGTAALLGFRFRKNFDRPLAATSLAQLWQRWHISLSTWLRDYLYRALRGEKRETGPRMYRNIFLTMLLGGLWHGANWTFVIWGAIHGVGLCAERIIKTSWHTFRTGRRLVPAGAAVVGEYPEQPGANRFATFVGWLITFHLFTLSAVFFRSPHLDVALNYFAAMFSFQGGSHLLTPFLLALTAASVAVQFLPGNKIERFAERARDWPPIILGLMLGTGLLLIEMIGPEGVAPFIYFQF